MSTLHPSCDSAAVSMGKFLVSLDFCFVRNYSSTYRAPATSQELGWAPAIEVSQDTGREGQLQGISSRMSKNLTSKDRCIISGRGVFALCKHKEKGKA